ncbi:MAG TPA: hypothetical protein VK835_15140 [Bacteroidia bacterium]|nr:hypothetical protein [Bacteroidia bacterium]
MKILCFILFIFSVELTAQSNKFMSLDIEHGSNTHRIKFYLQDKITFKLKENNKKHGGIITDVNDTALTLDSTTTILYKNINKVLVNNSNYLTRAASAFLIGCGVGYVALDALNNAINADKPILRLLDVEIGVGLVIIGEAIKILSIKRYKINKKHHIKFIDDTP